MTSTTNGTLAANVRGRTSIEASRLSIRSRNGGRTTLGALAFRAFARALAWLALFGRAGRSTGREIGVVCGADRAVRGSRAGADAFPGRGRVRRAGDGSAGRRPVLRVALLCPRRRSPPRGGGVSRLPFIGVPSSLPHYPVERAAEHVVAPRHSAGSAGPRRRRRVRRRASTR